MLIHMHLSHTAQTAKYTQTHTDGFRKKKKPQTVSMSQRPMHLHLNPRKDADKTVGFWGGERERSEVEG